MVVMVVTALAMLVMLMVVMSALTVLIMLVMVMSALTMLVVLVMMEPMGRGAWKAIVHRVAKIQTQLK